MFRLTALIGIVVVVAFIFWATKQFRKENENKNNNA